MAESDLVSDNFFRQSVSDALDWLDDTQQTDVVITMDAAAIAYFAPRLAAQVKTVGGAFAPTALDFIDAWVWLRML